MKKGMAMEGFILPDGTVKPSYVYDDAEVKAAIQTNKDNIDNLDSRVDALEEHGGAEDPTKADKVVGATSGNLASLDENGNLQDSGKKPADFANAIHIHNEIVETDADYGGESRVKCRNYEGAGSIKFYVQDGQGEVLDSEINTGNIANLNRALATPSSIPENDSTKLITSEAVYDALLGKMDDLRSMRITYDRVEEGFVVSESDKAVLVTFRNSVPADTFVPVLVSLYDNDTKDSDLFGLAKWSEEQQATATDINILVVIGKYYFFVNGDYQDIEDISFTGWTRTAKGQSFFS